MIPKGHIKPEGAVAAAGVDLELTGAPSPARRIGKKRRLPLLAAMVLAVGHYPLHLSANWIVPELTSVDLIWTTANSWDASLTYTAKSHPDATVSILNDYLCYAPNGHKHYAAVGSIPVLSWTGSIPYICFHPAHTLTDRVNMVNSFVFGTTTPVLGQQRILKAGHAGRGYVPDDPECAGAFITQGTPEWHRLASWPTGCMHTPPPNQQCVLRMLNSDVDVGIVEKGTRQVVKAFVSGTCSVDGRVVINSIDHSDSGAVKPTLHKTTIQYDGVQYDLPTEIWFTSKEQTTFSINLDMSFPVAGRTKTNFVVVWSPQ